MSTKQLIATQLRHRASK